VLLSASFRTVETSPGCSNPNAILDESPTEEGCNKREWAIPIALSIALAACALGRGQHRSSATRGLLCLSINPLSMAPTEKYGGV